MIFISYRRSDSAATAGRLYDFLEPIFGKESIFKDVDSIPLGRDFQQEIIAAIDTSEIVLVIIGRTFLVDERINNPSDYVRFEINYSLKADKIIIPILVDSAKMPQPSELPSEIQRLSLLNGFILRNSYWRSDCEIFLNILRANNDHFSDVVGSAPNRLLKQVKEIKDSRDGKNYKTIELDDRLWFRENLNYQIGSRWIKSKSWNYDNRRKHGQVYGRLYTWEAAMEACPPGWRLPTIEEYRSLVAFSTDYYVKRKREGTYRIQDYYKGAGALKKFGSSGFDLLMGGYFDSRKSIHWAIEHEGRYWTSADFGRNSKIIKIRYKLVGVLEEKVVAKTDGCYCRCIKDI